MAKSSVIGIDIGASESLVAYVGKGVVDLVQNEVSRRATPSLVGFTDRKRLLGDEALAQIRSNAKSTCRNFKHLLACDSASDIEKERFWSTSELKGADDGYVGYEVTYKGDKRVFSAVPVTAMFLTQLREITEKWCQAKVADAVISVPSFFTDMHRQALLDAAKIAGISVLRVMNEHTATALAYGIYRSNDFDPEKPMTVAFCSMGHSIFSIAIVQFVRGKLNVLCEKSDKVGGRDMDECLMREFASQFKKKHGGLDPLSNKKSAYKLEDAVTKTKKTLSANSEAPVTVDCLMEDEDFSSNITRADFEAMCQPMMDRVKAVLEGAKAMCSVPVEQIDSVEIVGASSRVPWLKSMCSQAFGGKELSTTMNADESVARGCALQAAILSPLYKVRDFKVEDTTRVPVSISWLGTAVDPTAPKEEEGDVPMIGGDAETKIATLFPAGSMMNMLKLLTFYRKGPFEIKAAFADEGALSLGTYKIEVPPQKEDRRIKVQAKMNLNGMFTIVGAQMVLEEEYEETVKEPKEAAADSESKPDGQKVEGDQKAAEAKVEMVDVVKKRVRVHRTDLKIIPTGRPGLSSEQLRSKEDEETRMQSEMKEIIETEDRRNDLESYILDMRNKIAETGEYGAYISAQDREVFMSDLTKAEDWLYDTDPETTKDQYIKKWEELNTRGKDVVWRAKEDGMREKWIKAVESTLINYRQAAENPGEKYGHIAADKRGKISAACEELQKWLTEKVSEQAKAPKSEKPVLLCADMERKQQELSSMANDILREPKPPPPKPPPKPKEEKKKEEEKKEDAPKEEAAPTTPSNERQSGPENMDIDD